MRQLVSREPTAKKLERGERWKKGKDKVVLCVLGVEGSRVGVGVGRG